MKDPIRPDFNKTYYGYHLVFGKKEYFITTDYKNLTKHFLNRILVDVFGTCPTEDFRRELKWYLTRGTLSFIDFGDLGYSYHLEAGSLIGNTPMENGTLRLYEILK